MLAVRDISVNYGNKKVLRSINLEIAEGEILCLLGPSGCGKTTLLRVIAGLVTPDSGDVAADGKSIISLPVHQRGFGLMFQDFALFPHLDAAENIAFGLKMQHVPRVEQIRRIGEVLEIVGLSGFERRDVASLSGGERQRVALARSLAPKPRLLMLDEPLGSLDAALRERLVVELRTIIRNLGLTAVYVTHDQQEAFAIADRMAVMNMGKIEQVGTPQQLYRGPATAFVARFLGLDNVISMVDWQQISGRFIAEKTAYMLLHPDGLRLLPEATGDSFNGVIEESVFQGEGYRLRVRIGKNAVLTIRWLGEVSPQIGQSVNVFSMPEYMIPLWM